jgi:transcriptional regulator with GAF, ATPase, and Fis domain
MSAVRRKDRPCIKVNCAAIPEKLFESEFFGHVKGAFTGANKDRVGRIQVADGGTLFLDEIAEIPISLQAKLLQVLQEQQFERVGKNRSRKVDVRIIAATNRDLEKEIEAGNFRNDLFYRLSVFPIEVPLLRGRREDIPLLTAHFLKMCAKKMNTQPPKLTNANIEQLQTYDWPGNVRELQNAVERAAIFAQTGALHFDVLRPSSPKPAGSVSSAPFPQKSDPVILTETELKRRERESIAAALKQANGKISGPRGAAEIARYETDNFGLPNQSPRLENQARKSLDHNTERSQRLRPELSRTVTKTEKISRKAAKAQRFKTNTGSKQRQRR